MRVRDGREMGIAVGLFAAAIFIVGVTVVERLISREARAVQLGRELERVRGQPPPRPRSNAVVRLIPRQRRPVSHPLPTQYDR